MLCLNNVLPILPILPILLVVMVILTESVSGVPHLSHSTTQILELFKAQYLTHILPIAVQKILLYYSY